jgi:hypothetical protein
MVSVVMQSRALHTDAFGGHDAKPKSSGKLVEALAEWKRIFAFEQ